METKTLPPDAHAPYLEQGAVLSPEALKEQEQRFRDLLETMMERAAEKSIVIRVIGSLAFRIRCPDHAHIEYENGRYLTDIDFVTRSRDIAGVQDMFCEMGWEENMTVLRLFGDKRRIFYHPELPLHSDIFIDKLRFCHEIDFRGRLLLDSPTITPADLLLEKLQIVEINRKDLIDLMVLLSQFPVSTGNGENDALEGARLASVCRKDWGWWRTATMNLEKTRDFASDYLSGDGASTVAERVNTLLEMVSRARKTPLWKLRSLFGDRLRWYREVEEVERE